MAMFDLTYKEAIEKREHLIALGDTKVYLRDDTDFPWAKATKVEAGSSYRLSGPSSARVIAEDQGLELSVSIDFEHSGANGKGVSLFDRDRLRDLASKLPPKGRRQFRDLLTNEILPGMAKRSAEIREALNSQLDSEDCVRGLIEFCEAESA